MAQFKIKLPVAQNGPSALCPIVINKQTKFHKRSLDTCFRFCIVKGDNPKIFNFGCLANLIINSNVRTPGKIFLLSGVGFMHFRSPEPKAHR